jgi:hypothetical protein
MIDGSQLVKDVIASKLKANGYKAFFAVTIGPAMQCFALPFYIFSVGTKIKHIAIAVSQLGSQILKGEYTIANWVWIAVDLTLFGEPVSIVDDNDFSLLHNETDSQIENFVNSIGG